MSEVSATVAILAALILAFGGAVPLANWIVIAFVEWLDRQMK